MEKKWEGGEEGEECWMGGRGVKVREQGGRWECMGG